MISLMYYYTNGVSRRTKLSSIRYQFCIIIQIEYHRESDIRKIRKEKVGKYFEPLVH